MSIQTLTKTLPVPIAPVESGIALNWKDVEREIGTMLPNDYKEFIGRYGTGRLGNFIWIFSPFSRNPNLQLQQQLKLIHETDRELGATFGNILPLPVFPSQNGVLPFGITDNGDYLSWLVAGPLNKWPVIVSESRAPEWEQFNLSMTEFLEAVLRKHRVCGIFPSDFPPERPIFVSQY